MQMEEGYHILEKKSIEVNNLLTFQEMSVIRWMQNTRNGGFEKFEDYTIVGLEELLSKVESQEELSKYMRKLLIENANYLVSTGATFQFVIDGSIEMWERPVIKSKEGKILNLAPIFGTLIRKDVNWFYQELNVQS